MKLDADVKAFLDMAQASGAPPMQDLPIEAIREISRTGKAGMDMPSEEVHRWLDRLIPGPNGEIPVRIYWPGAIDGATRRPALLMFHGGAFSLGDLDAFANQARHFCNSADAVVIDVDYRLAPENKFPAAVEDCYAALCWVAENADELGIDRGRIAVQGGSSGGTLAIVTCLLARERNGPPIALQIPLLPSLTMEPDPDYASRRELADPYYGLSRETLNWFAGLYLGKPEEAQDQRASPILAGDYHNLPRALVITAGFCPFRDEGMRYVERLREAGVAVEHVFIEGAAHAPMAMAGKFECARRGVDLVTDTLRRYL